MVFLFSGSVFSSYFYYLIPFIFTFALVFGVLVISNVFQKQKNVNAILALAIALFSIVYPPYIELLYIWLPYLCIIFLALFIILIFKNLFIKEGKELETTWPMLITIVILFLVFMFISPSIPLPNSSLVSNQDIMLLIGVAFVVIILIVGSRMKD